MSRVVDLPIEDTIGVNRKPKSLNIELYQGDDFFFYLAFAGTTLITTGWTAASTVKVVDTGEVVPGIITIDDIDTEENRFGITVESDSLSPDEEYIYDIQVTNALGKKRTYVRGKITVDEDVTEP